MEFAQNHKVARRRVGRAAHQHAEPQRRRCVRLAHGDGEVTLGQAGVYLGSCGFVHVPIVGEFFSVAKLKRNRLWPGFNHL